MWIIFVSLLSVMHYSYSKAALSSYSKQKSKSYYMIFNGAFYIMRVAADCSLLSLMNNCFLNAFHRFVKRLNLIRKQKKKIKATYFIYLEIVTYYYELNDVRECMSKIMIYVKISYRFFRYSY